ncbi:hypothetical protein METBIDRAFT_131818 [Metschnikowia bicuspidata var. bicuspidata NRRL YB-4993]|uniref:Uncharacterized protein n=1 Tax=Metschnikowia bicuspidata var. bicuspidata NRRL YB-4993 TaxID=869754 RepID=A0A1A0HK21_9ASCO|nr:hypothetical protein METBIDRAFT_131818 [Metschnikowia bicuspidata var. bicuspidata NRRL YB-4993]OBA24370.1 hypothetical protein METBIDRAFT_131818 [Metschnikowia bicuspidata var. bicuspidata NRRL YB-4993]
MTIRFFLLERKKKHCVICVLLFMSNKISPSRTEFLNRRMLGNEDLDLKDKRALILILNICRTRQQNAQPICLLIIPAIRAYAASFVGRRVFPG